VAVAPVGFGARGLPEHPVIGCGYEASDEGAAALGAAEELALALEGSLQVWHVIEPPSWLYDTAELPLNMPELDARMRSEAERMLGERVDHLSAALRDVDGTVQIGRPADRLIELTETVDLMVVGSRGYGPLRSVLLGGVSGQLIRSAACPVIVVPRGAHTTVGSLFGPSAMAESG
jgi:nucleotide-binding universal stress UspA family protein